VQILTKTRDSVTHGTCGVETSLQMDRGESACKSTPVVVWQPNHKTEMHTAAASDQTNCDLFADAHLHNLLTYTTVQLCSCATVQLCNCTTVQPTIRMFNNQSTEEHLLAGDEVVVFKAHRRMHHSTLGLGVITKQKKKRAPPCR